MKNTENQIKNMKEQTIGVEVEMNNITRRRAANLIADFFGTQAWNAASEYGYMTWACKDTQGRIWKFQRDCSIAGPDDEKCELKNKISGRLIAHFFCITERRYGGYDTDTGYYQYTIDVAKTYEIEQEED